MATTNQQLVQELQENGVLKTPRIKDAMTAIDRRHFVPENLADQAYDNSPLPIGQGQTISQPFTVAFMLEILQPQPGDAILDIGSGSGWQTSLLAHIVGPEGHIVAIERISELCEWSKKNIETYQLISNGRIEMHCMSGYNGFPDRAPYDKIVAAAAGQDIPQTWRDQLKVGGTIVTPVQNSIIRLQKTSETEWEQEEFPGFAFVPLISE